MSLKHFIKEVEKGLKQPSYLLYAGDSFILKEARDRVKATIPEADRDFLFNSFDAESFERPLEQILDILYTVPFFGGGGSRQVVAIENCQKLSDKEASVIEKYLKKPSPDSLLLMLYIAERGKFKKSHKETLSSAKSVPLDLRESEMPLWMSEKARAMGFELTGKAMDYLLGAIGPDFGLLSSEIEKLSKAGLKTLDRADIEALVKGSGGYDAFDLTDALKAKDPDRVFSIWSRMRDEADVQSLLGAINWQYSQGAREEDGKTLLRVYEILHEADLSLKSSGSYYPLEYVLFRLLRA